MPLPKEPVTLSVKQIDELNKQIALLRHEVNNNVSLIIAATEIMRRHPERAETLWNGLTEKPQKIAEVVTQFSLELEKTLQIRRP